MSILETVGEHLFIVVGTIHGIIRGTVVDIIPLFIVPPGVLDLEDSMLATVLGITHGVRLMDGAEATGEVAGVDIGAIITIIRHIIVRHRVIMQADVRIMEAAEIMQEEVIAQVAVDAIRVAETMVLLPL